MKDDIMLGDTPKALKRRGRVQGTATRGRLWKHSKLSDLDGLLAPEELPELFVFTLVRNPWDRMVSYYHWLREQSFDHPAVGLAQAIAGLRAEADDLHDRLAGMAGPGGPRAAPPRPAVGPATAPAGSASEPARPAMPMPAPKPAAAPVPTRPAAAATDSRQTALRFEATESEAVAMDDLIRALDFPDGPDDAEGIAALRRALRDHDAARVLRSAQDVVTLLAQGDVYMDDVTPGATDLALWRRFGEGVRGAGVVGMAVVDDPDAIERVTAMIRGDEIFRDAAHHFLRHFDLALVRWLPQMSNDDISALAGTRSALAFLLLGRVTGLFG